MQTPRPQPDFDRLRPDPFAKKLPPPHDPVLPLGQSRDPRINTNGQPTSPLQPVHNTGKGGLARDPPPEGRGVCGF